MRALLGTAALLVALALTPAVASAQAPGEPWDGTNPFDCVLQQAGTGTDFPDPDADPFCVEYDKRYQNVTEAGVVDFLLLEPARVAAASGKCFYFQHDHWVGSVVQEDGSTRTYEWDGSYYFDKAKGTGGVYVENFRVNNRASNPNELPGFPAEYSPYFGAGRGGFHRAEEGQYDPACVAKANEQSPYRKDPEPPPPGRNCSNPGGAIGRSIGPDLRLGATRAQTLERRGDPLAVRRGFLRFCIVGGGKYLAGFPSNRAGVRAMFLYSSNPAFHIRNVRRLTPSRQALRRLPSARLLFRTRYTRIFAVRRRDHVVLLFLRGGRVRALASAERSLSRAQMRRYWLRAF